MARTCSTSLVPMPKANAPSAPWVEVCESPHTMVMPGRVRPCSGPMICTMPWRASPISNRVRSKSLEDGDSGIGAMHLDTGGPQPGEGLR